MFSRFVGTFLTGGFFDTSAASRPSEPTWPRPVRHCPHRPLAFDVELLYLALLHHVDIKRIPVELRNNETSAVRLVRDSLRMILDVGRIRLFASRGLYQSPASPPS